mgnify:CR=1 FL=1
MKIDKNLISKLEKLAQLDLSPKEKQTLERDLNKILDMIDKMNELDTSKVEPLRHISPQFNQLREDKIENQVTREDGLSNAPLHDGTHFKVPKVIPDKK